MSYASLHGQSLSDPEGFWRERAAEIPWLEFPRTILDQDANGAWRWFGGGRTNTCWLALDRHVDEGRGGRTALIHDSPVTGAAMGAIRIISARPPTPSERRQYEAGR